jgi:hypothetical protein
VHDPERVRRRERLGDLRGQRHRLVHGQDAAPKAAREVLPIEPLHGQVEFARLGHAVCPITDDPRMIKSG